MELAPCADVVLCGVFASAGSGCWFSLISSSQPNLFKAPLPSRGGSRGLWCVLTARIYFPDLGDDTVMLCLVRTSQRRCKERTRNYFVIDGRLLRLPLGCMWKMSCVSTLNCPDLKNACNLVSSWTGKIFFLSFVWWGRYLSLKIQELCCTVL